MATQLSFDEYPSHARGQLSYDMAAALAAKPTPSYPSYPPAGSHSYSHSAHPNRQISYIPFPPAAHPYYSEQANAYVSGYLPSDHMSSYGSLSDQYAPSQWHLPPLAPSQPQYSSIQLPAAGSFVHIPLGHSSLDHGVLHEVPLLPQNPSAAVEHPYQTLLDAQRSAAQPSWSVSGSLNPTTGAFQRAPDGPRLRTAQACEKCRIRKAKVRIESICIRADTNYRFATSVAESIPLVRDAAQEAFCASMPPNGECEDPTKTRERV